MDLSLLKEPFKPKDIEWRVQQAGAKNDKPWAMVLAYVTNRAIMNRLDDVCGPFNWKNHFKAGPDGGILCGISIKVGDEWVTKWDGATNTNVVIAGKPDTDTNTKGGLSNSMKRAAVQWGVGRYLYDLEVTFAQVNPNGRHYQPGDKGGKYPAFKWNPPPLPEWALPKNCSNEPIIPNIPQQPAPPQKILANQVDTVEDLIKEKGADKAKLLEYYGLKSLDDMLDHQYADAIVNLRKKKAAA